MEFFNGPTILIFLVTLVIEIAVAVVVVRYLTKTQSEKFRKDQESRADNVVQVANEKAKSILLDAKDKSIRIQQESESELSRRRSELAREEERMTKRRADLDTRMEKLEQREQAQNKRQS